MIEKQSASSVLKSEDTYLSQERESSPGLQATEHLAFSQEPQISPEDSKTFPLVSSFVDVFSMGEWTAGFLLEVGEQVATVVVNGPYVEEKRIQVPMEEIAVFRSKTSRSSLVSHLDACIWKYAQIDLCHELQSFLATPNESEDRLVQVFAGVLPIGCAVWNSCLSPEEWDKERLALICIALTQFLTRIVSSQVSISTFSRIWRSLSDAETIFLPLLKTLPEFPALLKVHFQVITLEDCPGCVIQTFKDLMTYCCPPQLTWIMPDDTELLKTPLNKDTFHVYGQASIKYMKDCIANLEWLEAFKILLQILIVNAQSVSPVLNSENLNALLSDITSFESYAPSQTKSNVALLLFSPPWKADTLSNKNLLYWFSICSTACTDLLSTAPISTSLAFLQNCQSADSDSLLTRLAAEKLNCTFQEMITRVYELIPLFCALKAALKTKGSGHDRRDPVESVQFSRFIETLLSIEPSKLIAIHPAHWQKLLTDFLCAELTFLFYRMKYAPENTDIVHIMPVMSQFELMLLESIPEDNIAKQNVLLAHT